MSNETLNEKDSSPERFQSDSQKVVHRHLEDEKDIITEDDIRNIRIGVMPPTEDSSQEKLNEVVEDIEKEDEGKDPGNTDDPITPWDTVQR